MGKNSIIEGIANYEHDRWSRWQKYLFSKSIKNKDGSFTIPKEYVERWTKQMNTTYYELPHNEQESDKKEAKRILNVIREVNNNEKRNCNIGFCMFRKNNIRK